MVFEVARSRIRQNSGRFAVRQLPSFRQESGDFGYSCRNAQLPRLAVRLASLTYGLHSDSET